MTTNTAVNVAGHGEKEKAEKRRALGRGLESLLPGPRAVSSSFARKEGTAGPEAGRETAAHSGPGQREVVRGPIVGSASPEAAELHAAGQPGAAVPTFHSAAVAPLRSLGGNDPAVEAGAEEPIEIQAMADTRIPANLVVNVAIGDIDKNPFQTRYVEDDDALDELADSIKANGVVQPIVVRPAEDEGRYILVLGERRLHASKKAGKTHIPALVRRISEQQAAEMTIVENLQREDLSPLEQAQAFKVLSTQFNLTQEEIGKRVGLSRVSIANYMRLLKLPREVMELLAQKSLTFAEAKELLALENADQIAHAAIYAVKKGMPGQEKKPSGARWVDPNVRAAQMDLERTLGMRVRIRDRKGRGKIVIEYSTLDDYERVVEMLRGKKK